MISLTEVSQKFKQLLKYGAIGLLSLLILRLGFQLLKTVWQRIHPPEPPAPTVSFDQLPPIDFPDQASLAGLEYSLETPTNELPELPPQVKVYRMAAPQPDLLAPQRAEEKATNLGFNQPASRLSEQVYQWQDSRPLTATLEMNIFTNHFSYTYDWQNDSTLLRAKNLPDEETAIKQTQNFIQQVHPEEKLPDDLEEGEYQVGFLKAQTGKMVPAVSLSEADFVKVKIFRRKVDDRPVLTPDPNQGLVNVILSGLPGARRVIKAESHYQPIDYQASATYPIKSAQLAWEELNQGRAFLASWQEDEQVTIRRIYLSYFDSFSPQEYLQPIIVFQGDNNFTAYVPAVTDEWLGE